MEAFRGRRPTARAGPFRGRLQFRVWMGTGSRTSWTAAVLSPYVGCLGISIDNVLHNHFPDGRNTWYIAYVEQSNTLMLVDDAGDAGGPFAGAVTPGNSGAVIENGQCAVSLA